MDGLNFNTNTPPPHNNNMFGLMDINMGGSQPQTLPPQSSGGFGGDLLGFGMETTQQSLQTPPQTYNTQPGSNNNNFMNDFMGFGTTTPPPIHQVNQQVNQQNNPNNMYGMNLLSNNSGFSATTQQTPPPQNTNNFGFNLLGSNQPPVQAPIQQVQQNTSSSFQPIINNNPNKILAYENQHLQIWMDCIKESNDSTKVFTTYVNKTNNNLVDIKFQGAVLKHVKLTINSLNSTTLPPYSKEVVHQVIIY